MARGVSDSPDPPPALALPRGPPWTSGRRRRPEGDQPSPSSHYGRVRRWRERCGWVCGRGPRAAGPGLPPWTQTPVPESHVGQRRGDGQSGQKVNTQAASRREGAHPCPPSAAGQAQRDLGSVSYRLLPTLSPGPCVWVRPATSQAPAPGPADPQAEGGRLSSSKGLRQLCLLSRRPRVGQEGSEAPSEQGNGAVPVRPAFPGGRAAQPLGALRFHGEDPGSSTPPRPPGLPLRHPETFPLSGQGSAQRHSRSPDAGPRVASQLFCPADHAEKSVP